MDQQAYSLVIQLYVNIIKNKSTDSDSSLFMQFLCKHFYS